MAARLNKRHTELVVQKLRVGQLLRRLQDHGLGLNEMTKTQIMAAKICIGKVIADRKAVEHSGEIVHKDARELTMAELDERIARATAREEAPASGTPDATGLH